MQLVRLKTHPMLPKTVRQDKVENGSGYIEVKDQQIVSVVGNEFTHIMKTAQGASNSMSDAQQEKIVDRIRKSGDAIKDFPIFKDWGNDRRISKQ